MGVIVALSGLAGSGKDTVAEYLVRDHGFVQVAFADPLKRIAMDLWDMSYEQLWGPSEERNKPDKRYLFKEAGALGTSLVGWSDDGKRIDEPNPKENVYLSPRMVLQTLGTEVAREIDADVWLRYGLKVARTLLQQPDSLDYTRELGVFEARRNRPITGVVISDARFTNELCEIQHQKGGKLVRIKRPGVGLKGDAGKHLSEMDHQGWDDEEFDWIIDNSGSLDDLKNKVSEMVRLWGIEPTESKQLELPL